MRKTETVVVPAEWGGRDAGKNFQITEWPAAVAEDWAFRFLFACGRGGADVDFNRALGAGWEFIFWSGVNTLLRGAFVPDEVIPLLNRLLECVQIIRDPTKPDASGKPVASAIIADDDIAEIRTRLWLRSEVIRVHANFSVADVASAYLAAMERTKSEGTTSSRLSGTPPTSPP